MSDDWVTVRALGTEEEAALIAGFLDSEGITAVVESRRFSQEPVTFGQLGRVEVKVPAEELERAAELLAQGGEPPPD